MYCFTNCYDRLREEDEYLAVDLQFRRKNECQLHVSQRTLRDLKPNQKITLAQCANFHAYAMREDGDIVNIYDMAIHDGITALVASIYVR